MAADDRKETEAREARGHGGQEKKPGPAIKAFSFYQPEYNNESRTDSHQTSQDVDQRVGCGCHPAFYEGLEEGRDPETACNNCSTLVSRTKARSYSFNLRVPMERFGFR